MHVRSIRGVGRIGRKELVQRRARPIRESRRKLRSLAATMTKSAQINLTITGKLSRIKDCPIQHFGLPCYRFLLPLNVCSSWSMTRLALNADNQAAPVENIRLGVRRKRTNIGCVALQASRVHMTSKVSLTVCIARTVDPLVSNRPIAHGKFKQFIPFPIQVSLPA